MLRAVRDRGASPHLLLQRLRDERAFVDVREHLRERFGGTSFAIPIACISRMTRRRPRPLTSAAVRANARATRASSSARRLEQMGDRRIDVLGVCSRSSRRSRSCAQTTRVGRAAAGRRCRRQAGRCRRAGTARGPGFGTVEVRRSGAGSGFGCSRSGAGIRRLTPESRNLRDLAPPAWRPRHLLAGHVGGRRDALHLELELVDVRGPAQRLFERENPCWYRLKID